MPGRPRGKPTRPNRTISSRCDLTFSVGRANSYLKRGRYAERVGKGGGIFMAAVLEYVTNEILELAGNAAIENKKKRILPRHIMLAMKNDEELNKLVALTTIAQGGVLPNVHGFLFSKTTGGRKATTEQVQSTPAM